MQNRPVMGSRRTEPSALLLNSAAELQPPQVQAPSGQQQPSFFSYIDECASTLRDDLTLPDDEPPEFACPYQSAMGGKIPPCPPPPEPRHLMLPQSTTSYYSPSGENMQRWLQETEASMPSDLQQRAEMYEAVRAKEMEDIRAAERETRRPVKTETIQASVGYVGEMKNYTF